MWFTAVFGSGSVLVEKDSKLNQKNMASTLSPVFVSWLKCVTMDPHLNTFLTQFVAGNKMR